jgi:hypothetical protein
MYWQSLLLLWLSSNLVLIGLHLAALRRVWREPVIRRPILVLESDDWGAGPQSQAEALQDIAAVLARHRDATGRAAVLNLGLVLSVADGSAIRATGAYHRIRLIDPLFGSVLKALREGCSRGVFGLQLHGMEHYWPDALMSSTDTTVRDWLQQSVPAMSEHLPSHLQSRWVNAACLPSKPHSQTAVRAAVAEEVKSFALIFGALPKVVVPPTFVWTREVEAAWAENGLECVVTPGWRSTCRNAAGIPDGDEGPLVNGDLGGGVVYLVRTDYFEPARGRDAANAICALVRSAAQGRPCLLENHRDNFINEPRVRQHSLNELDKLCREALVCCPALRFLTSWELARILRDRDPAWVVTRFTERLPFLWARLSHTGRLWKLMNMTGLTAVIALFVRLLGTSPVPLVASGRLD